MTHPGTLDLAAVDAVVNRAADLTGIPAANYTVSLQPQIDLSGSLAGRPFDTAGARPDPALTLAVTPSTVVPALAGTPTTGDTVNADAQPSRSAGGAATTGQPLTPDATAHSTTVSRPRSVTRNVLERSVPVTPVRWAGMAGTALGLLMLLRAGPKRNDPCVREARRHPGSIITVSGLAHRTRRQPTRGRLHETLVQVAQRYDRLILWPATTPGVYLVQVETGLYRYQCAHREPSAHPRRYLSEQPRTQRPDSESAQPRLTTVTS